MGFNRGRLSFTRSGEVRVDNLFVLNQVRVSRVALGGCDLVFVKAGANPSSSRSTEEEKK